MSRLTAVDLYISEATDDQQGVLQELRDLIFEAVPDVKEQFKWSQPVYGTTKDFVYLKHTKKHLNLGFFNFEKVDDPDGLLEGTGKRMRHIKIIPDHVPDRAVLKAMITQAAKF